MDLTLLNSHGDVDGNWGDSQNYATSNRVLQNLANDGKWDRLNNSAPTNLSFEVSVGRIDFEGLPAFASYVSPAATSAYDLEIKLLTRYLSKVHAYRTGNLTFDPSLRLFMQGGANGSFSQLGKVAQTLATKNLGQALMEQEYAQAFVQTPTSRPATLWGLQGGLGTYSGFQGLQPTDFHSSQALANGNRRADFAFGVLCGSYFPDWGLNSANNFLRAVLAQPNTGLAMMWDYQSANQPWDLSAQGNGSPLAFSLQSALNSKTGQSVRTIYLLGDPTLRSWQVNPPTSLMRSGSGSSVTLTWSPSTTPGSGYWVYKSSNLVTPSWLKITTGAPITSLSYSTTATGPNLFMVRAVALAYSGSGSFTNLGTGIILNVP